MWRAMGTDVPSGRQIHGENSSVLQGRGRASNLPADADRLKTLSKKDAASRDPKIQRRLPLHDAAEKIGRKKRLDFHGLN
jgi:hypothetical protein